MVQFTEHYQTPAGHKAYDEIYRRWRPRIYAYQLAVMRSNFTVAEDLTQETFCRVIDKKDLFDPQRGNFSCWIYTLAANLKNDFGRSMKYRVASALESVLNISGDHPPVELRVLVAECLDELETFDRHVVYLTAIEGFTLVEASKILKVSVGTVWRRRAAAFKQLQAAFQRSAEVPKHAALNKEKES